jgi:hypothetical protein
MRPVGVGVKMGSQRWEEAMAKINTHIRSLSFQSWTTPKTIRVVLADAETEEGAGVWISARFPFEGRTDDKLGVLVQDALRHLQTLIGEAIEAAKAPPG